jgi:hypothetical protein
LTIQNPNKINEVISAIDLREMPRTIFQVFNIFFLVGIGTKGGHVGDMYSRTCA